MFNNRSSSPSPSVSERDSVHQHPQVINLEQYRIERQRALNPSNDQETVISLRRPEPPDGESASRRPLLQRLDQIAALGIGGTAGGTLLFNGLQAGGANLTAAAAGILILSITAVQTVRTLRGD